MRRGRSPAKIRMAWAALARSACFAAGSAQGAAIQLISNGGFETGNFAPAWSVSNLAGSSGSFFVDTPGSTTPLFGIATAANPGGGSFYAVSDQNAPGTHALTQSFTVPVGATSVILTFEMFVNSGAALAVNPAGLDHTASPNQHARIDILTAGASVFDTGAGVLTNLFIGVDPLGSNPNPFTAYTFDITGLGAGTFQLRFAEVDNQLFLNMGVDNVSIVAMGDITATPSSVVAEPASLTLLLTGIAGLGLAARRRRKRAD